LHLIFFAKGNISESIKYFKQILIWNPNDNQGVREILADIYVKEKNWQDMLDLAKVYSSNVNPSVGYGEALALYKAGEIEKATKKLRDCIQRLPLCAQILLEDGPVRPRSRIQGYITFGGEDQAYEFWQCQAEAWQDKEIKVWLKHNLED
jgi:tetratricopeptide (TPR) repeat protein